MLVYPKRTPADYVVLEEVAYRGVDGEDTAVQIQVVQDQQVVRVVA